MSKELKWRSLDSKIRTRSITAFWTQSSKSFGIFLPCKNSSSPFLKCLEKVLKMILLKLLRIWFKRLMRRTLKNSQNLSKFLMLLRFERLLQRLIRNQRSLRLGKWEMPLKLLMKLWLKLANSSRKLLNLINQKEILRMWLDLNSSKDIDAFAKSYMISL